MTTRIYRGTRGGRVTVTDDGRAVGLLRHYVRHSPTGFSWGYGGSGPADLARSLLIDALGDLATCPVCAGSGSVVYDPQTGRDIPAADDADPELVGACFSCDDGIRMLPYQDFKFDRVARWPVDGWTISRDQIRAWAAPRLATVPSA